jgi:hypothetical protein
VRDGRVRPLPATSLSPHQREAFVIASHRSCQAILAASCAAGPRFAARRRLPTTQTSLLSPGVGIHPFGSARTNPDARSAPSRPSLHSPAAAPASTRAPSSWEPGCGAGVAGVSALPFTIPASGVPAAGSICALCCGAMNTHRPGRERSSGDFAQPAVHVALESACRRLDPPDG